MNDICAINKLPSDILYYLSNWLKLNDYYNLSQVSNYYRVTIINHDSYWRKMIIPTHQFLAMEMQVNLFALKF